jgi:anti-anti-sigma regulatory factor
MLRITRIEINGSAVTLKLAGKIHGEWVVLLERECRALIRQKKDISLDCSEVTFIDSNGVSMMQHLGPTGIHIINPPDFIETLLDQGGKP